MMNLIPGVAQIKTALRLLPYVGIAALAIFAALQWQNARHWSKVAMNEKAAHSATVARYEGAQTAAMEINKAEVARIKSEYAKIALKSETDYAKNLADNRAALSKWMRTQAAKSASQGTGASGQPEMPSDPMPETTEAQFLVTGRDLEIASDNYSQLVGLIAWAENIGEVETVPTPDD